MVRKRFTDRVTSTNFKSKEIRLQRDKLRWPRYQIYHIKYTILKVQDTAEYNLMVTAANEAINEVLNLGNKPLFTSTIHKVM